MSDKKTIGRIASSLERMAKGFEKIVGFIEEDRNREIEELKKKIDQGLAKDLGDLPGQLKDHKV